MERTNMHYLKGQFPFRLGTSSYIIPADILPNVEFLRDKIDDIELVLFESDEISNIPDGETVRQLKELSEAWDLTYTVHLPLDADLGHPDEDVRRRSVQKCLRIIERMSPVSPFAYIVHFSKPGGGMGLPEDLDGWLRQAGKSAGELADVVPSRDLCVETLSFPFEVLEDVIQQHDMSVCLDIGHILKCGYSLEEYFTKYFERTRVIHLHGIENGEDHRDISHLSQHDLELILGALWRSGDEWENGRMGERASCAALPLSHSPTPPFNAHRVLTLEIFGEAEFSASIDVLRRYTDWAK